MPNSQLADVTMRARGFVISRMTGDIWFSRYHGVGDQCNNSGQNAMQHAGVVAGHVAQTTQSNRAHSEHSFVEWLDGGQQDGVQGHDGQGHSTRLQYRSMKRKAKYGTHQPSQEAKACRAPARGAIKAEAKEGARAI